MRPGYARRSAVGNTRLDRVAQRHFLKPRNAGADKKTLGDSRAEPPLKSAPLSVTPSLLCLIPGLIPLAVHLAQSPTIAPADARTHRRVELVAFRRLLSDLVAVSCHGLLFDRGPNSDHRPTSDTFQDNVISPARNKPTPENRTP